MNHQNPLLPALLSIDLEQEARLDDHEERLEELENELNEENKRQQLPKTGTTEDGLH